MLKALISFAVSGFLLGVLHASAQVDVLTDIRETLSVSLEELEAASISLSELSSDELANLDYQDFTGGSPVTDFLALQSRFGDLTGEDYAVDFQSRLDTTADELASLFTQLNEYESKASTLPDLDEDAQSKLRNELIELLSDTTIQSASLVAITGDVSFVNNVPEIGTNALTVASLFPEHYVGSDKATVLPTLDNMAVGFLSTPDRYYPKSRSAMCTGSLIAPSIILTAAHCFCDPDTESNTDLNFEKCGKFGTENIADYEFFLHGVGPRKLSQVFLPSSFQFFEQADFAIALLQNPVTEVSPLRLDLNSSFDANSEADELIIVGYGRTTSKTEIEISSGTRTAWRGTGVQVAAGYTPEDCEKVFARSGSSGPNNARFICWDSNLEKARVITCNGDSGGPSLKSGRILSVTSGGGTKRTCFDPKRFNTRLSSSGSEITAVLDDWAGNPPEATPYSIVHSEPVLIGNKFGANIYPVFLTEEASNLRITLSGDSNFVYSLRARGAGSEFMCEDQSPSSYLTCDYGPSRAASLEIQVRATPKNPLELINQIADPIYQLVIVDRGVID